MSHNNSNCKLYSPQIQNELSPIGSFFVQKCKTSFSQRWATQLKQITDCIFLKLQNYSPRNDKISVLKCKDQTHFICHGDQKNVIFDPQYALFSFDECLQRPKEATTIYNLPPCHQDNDKDLGGQQNYKDPGGQQNDKDPGGQQNLSSSESQIITSPDDQISPRFSKRGRLLKPPN